VLADPADETSKTGGDIFHYLEEHSVLIPRLEDQTLTLFVCSGPRFIDGGKVATFQVYGGANYAGGRGAEIGYQVIDFQDGSSQVLQFSSMRTPDGNETATFQGTFEVVTGSGRFADSAGKGSYEGKSIGNNGYLDWAME
jgi:hypothetical protein